MTEKKLKVCMISSSGGHFEQLKMLKPLGDKYDLYWVTEKTDYNNSADYFLRQCSNSKIKYYFNLFLNCFISLKIFLREKPDFIVSTGTMVALPTIMLTKLFRKKLIYIETFARVNGATKAGKFFCKYADLFIIQWEALRKEYPNSVFGGSIY